MALQYNQSIQSAILTCTTQKSRNDAATHTDSVLERREAFWWTLVEALCPELHAQRTLALLHDRRRRSNLLAVGDEAAHFREGLEVWIGVRGGSHRPHLAKCL